MPARTAKKSAAKRTTAKTSGRSATPSARTSGKGGGQRRAKRPAAPPGLSRPVQPDSELAAVVGARPLPRTQVVKKLWDYVKSEGLQDSKNRRMINADAKLKPIFNGKKKVSMFEMAKLISDHVS
jgi:chromatin remodeling complex protein RSC6